LGWAGGGAELERAERSSRRRMADGGDGEQDRAEQSEREGRKDGGSCSPEKKEIVGVEEEGMGSTAKWRRLTRRKTPRRRGQRAEHWGGVGFHRRCTDAEDGGILGKRLF